MDFERFDLSSPEIKDIIRHWYRQAIADRFLDKTASFASFIHLWLAFNGWIACCDDEPSDSKLVEKAARSARLAGRFRHLGSTPAFHAELRAFAQWWPVFSASDARRKSRTDNGIDEEVWRLSQIETRRVAAEFLTPRVKHRPRRVPYRTWLVDDLTPMQTLQAIYQVRCNLFHGGKAPAIGADAELVGRSYRILLKWLEGIAPFRDWNNDGDFAA